MLSTEWSKLQFNFVHLEPNPQITIGEFSHGTSLASASTSSGAEVPPCHKDDYQQYEAVKEQLISKWLQGKLYLQEIWW